MKEPALSLRREARPFPPNPAEWDELIDALAPADIVLLGEASHGTHDFYHDRAMITSRLIREKGFNVVAAEADWPDAYRVNRYVRGESADPDAGTALEGFKRFPTWMWRNRVMVEFVEWLRHFNAEQSDPASRAGFYGIDLYSLHASIDAVVSFLEKRDPAAAARARDRYGCFDHFDGDPQRYGYQTATNQAKNCEEEVIAQLVELRKHAADFLKHGNRDNLRCADAVFSAQQNARLISNAEEYYRSMFQGRHATWNLRDTHMADTVEELLEHREDLGLPTKLIVWAHNSHLGDARATSMAKRGEINLGQILRQRHEEKVASVGFTTYDGSVTAAPDWNSPTERKSVLPALPDSWEALFHRSGLSRFFLDLRDPGPELRALLTPARLQRAIGVIYRPQTERTSHYYQARLLDQFDFVIHLDRTEAVEPLDRGIHWQTDELPETYPFTA